MYFKAVLFASCLLYATQLGQSQQACVTRDEIYTVVNNVVRVHMTKIEQSLRVQQTLLQRMQGVILGFISIAGEQTRDKVGELLREKPSREDMNKALSDMLEEVTQQLTLAHNSTEEHVTQELRELQQSHRTTFTEVLKNNLEDFLQQCRVETTTTLPPPMTDRPTARPDTTTTASMATVPPTTQTQPETKTTTGETDGPTAPSMSPTTAMPTQPEASTTSIPTTAEPAIPCGGPGWRRVVLLNMTNTSQTCPTGLSLTRYSKRTCGRSNDGLKACSSTTFSVGGTPYSKVCGRAKGYQWFEAYAFLDASNSIDDYYVHGVTLTRGASGSREHIWTFAIGLQIGDLLNRNSRCPCDPGATSPPPSFVGNDYYCDSGTHNFLDNSDLHRFPLWDGQDCTFRSTCCQRPDLPWFYKDLPASATDDIELRLCCLNRAFLSNIALEQLELYVQ